MSRELFDTAPPEGVQRDRQEPGYRLGLLDINKCLQNGLCTEKTRVGAAVCAAAAAANVHHVNLCSRFIVQEPYDGLDLNQARSVSPLAGDITGVLMCRGCYDGLPASN